MIRPLALFIGLRYTRAKRRNRFISFISLASILGIALGVTVLITVLSVMNGFDYQIRHRFFAIVPQVTAATGSDISQDWQKYQKAASKIKGITGVAPFVSGKGMLLQDGQIHGLEIMGIEPQQEPKVSELRQKIVAGSLLSLHPKQFNIVLGQTLATSLGLQIGDHVNLFTPQASVTLAGIFPRFRQFTISGLFHVSQSFGLDNTVAYISMQDAQRLFHGGHAMSGLHVRLANIYQTQQVTERLAALLPPIFVVNNWTQQFGAFFQALAMEKTILFVILLLIIAVAVFNLVSTLMMVVNDKRSDIAILRTLGATPRTIMSTFIIQGAVVGIIGTIVGLLLGLALAENVTAIANAIQHIFGVQFVNSSVFFLNFVPSKIQFSDVWHVCLWSIGLSLLATIYPASVAFRTQPAEALRYE